MQSSNLVTSKYEGEGLKCLLFYTSRVKKDSNSDNPGTQLALFDVEHVFGTWPVGGEDQQRECRLQLVSAFSADSIFCNPPAQSLNHSDLSKISPQFIL